MLSRLASILKMLGFLAAFYSGNILVRVFVWRNVKKITVCILTLKVPKMKMVKFANSSGPGCSKHR